MTMELPAALFGKYADVTRAIRKIYAEVKAGQDFASVCGSLVPIHSHSGHVVVTGPDRLSRDQLLFRPHLLHDVASTQAGGRELQTWIVDPLLNLKWGGLCLVSQETKGICKDVARSHAMLAWALRWFDDLEALGPVFGDDRPFPMSPTFCRAPTTLLMAVAASGVPLEDIRNAASASSSHMRELFEKALTNCAARRSSTP
jgi:hypothetical protein